MEKKVIIDLKSFLYHHAKAKGTKQEPLTKVAESFGVTRQSLANWEMLAPDVVQVLFVIKKENPQTDIIKALKNWQKPPFVLVFIRDFLEKYQCDFEDLVKEVQA